MKKSILFSLCILLFPWIGKTQSPNLKFDSITFDKQLEIANQLIECEYYTQLAVDEFSKLEDISSTNWFSFSENQTWHTVGGISDGNTFRITKHVIFDSANTISDFTGISDTSKLIASFSALAKANTLFQIIRDTSNLYFNSFVLWHPDQTISVWILPAFQPSGQAIYGGEWEYIFDKSGKTLIKQNSFINRITGVWIGQPRELWLNYRNTDKPTLGSVFFAQSFRDYFTRIRIDTKTSTSTTKKETNGKYSWSHRMK